MTDSDKVSQSVFVWTAGDERVHRVTGDVFNEYSPDWDPDGNFIEFVDFEREVHAAGGTELIDEDLGAGMTFDVLEEKRGASGRERAASIVSARHLADPVGDLGNLENGVDFGTNLL